MNNPSRNNYLQAEVLTASPQKLQLMLIEAAIRNVRQGKDAIESGQSDSASGPLRKAQDIVGQILSGLRSEHDLELVGKVASIYVFVLRTLAEGMLAGDAQRLASVLHVLQEERTTWKQLCDQLGESAGPRTKLSGPHRQQVLKSLPTTHAGATAPSGGGEDDVNPHGRFSLEA